VPVAHGNEAAVLSLRLASQRRLQRRRLRLGQFQQWRAAAENRVILGGGRGAALGEELAQPGADEAGHAQDGGVGEQVLEERADAFRPVRPAKVEQHHRNPLHARSPGADPSDALAPPKVKQAARRRAGGASSPDVPALEPARDGHRPARIAVPEKSYPKGGGWVAGRVIACGGETPTPTLP
jgi:hypothetical protein